MYIKVRRNETVILIEEVAYQQAQRTSSIKVATSHVNTPIKDKELA
jgi:hypothetical protein